MISKNLITGSSWLPVRSALFSDSTSKCSCPIQYLFHDTLNATRQFFRGLFKNNSLSSGVYRKQHRLPVEYFKDNVQPSSATKFKFGSYKSGSIYRVTSRWCTNSLTNSWREDLFRKFYRGGRGPMLCFVGFALAKKPSLLTEEEELEGVSFLIRESFSSLPFHGQGLNIDKGKVLSNITLADLKIGELIAKGCNAAIYSACVSDQIKSSSELKELGKDVSYFNISSEKSNDMKKDNPELTECGKNIGPLLVSSNYVPRCQVQQGMKKDEDNLELTEYGKNIPPLPASSNYMPHFQVQQGIFDENIETKEMGKNPENSVQNQFFMPHFEGHQNQNDGVQKNVTSEIETFGKYNMAVKVMFNYSAESNAYAIWNAMYRETLPLFGEFSFGDAWETKVRKKKLKPHPNIVKMYSAFADQFPLLPGATKSFPQALPSRLLNDGCGRNMTLFLVMKRYHCCLKDYLRSQNIRPETSLLLFTQLLEALVHLFQNGITHRDLKSDNILLDLSLGIASPRLAIADFGCCLENLSLPYTSYDINKGGNISLMAPEVVKCEPGPFSVIDYSRADLWAAGTIAYEIFGGNNPFYSHSSVKNSTYKEEDLPPFPKNAPPAVKSLVVKMLSVNPSQRPSPNFAATVCQLLLHAPPSLLFGTFDGAAYKRALKWMFQLSAKTYLEASVLQPEDMSVKLELRSTLCSRIQYLEVIEALQFILKS
ncbi:serine/threonine-protein kinase Pink1, mitochondrial isoform X2 [Parasteatoda tepidariorum]|uniref:serine/threonine-protein kinase Pink1, mitochondrial isoform X2 n=1 Tax=Parasteatoda tepidariorum TaxID=114398 RepID=UPI001C71E08B|nr:serine/threonine-protein kinase Pink1, mitochondrial isoform X1 [Parasteatoda tepidariorum]